MRMATIFLVCICSAGQEPLLRSFTERLLKRDAFLWAHFSDTVSLKFR